MAGRNQAKLDAARAKLGAAAADVPILIGDSHDVASLEALVARTKVVCSTVGPYAKYGSELVAACVRSGTDYCDLAGEAHWIRKMFDAHQAKAEQTGARIVHACGMDSIPSDIGVFFLQREAKKRHGKPCSHIKMRTRRLAAGPSRTMRMRMPMSRNKPGHLSQTPPAVMPCSHREAYPRTRFR